MHDTITIWVSRYALSKGVYEATAVYLGSGVVKVTSERPYYFIRGAGKHWHWTRAGAVSRAEQMRQHNIARLHKQIEKLQATRFE